MKKFVTQEQVNAFNNAMKNNKELSDAVVGFGSQMYQGGIVKGLFIALVCMASPIIVYGANYLARRPHCVKK